ncbi:NADase-type glycan-binding domain-containing protein [Nocardioides dilutus]
MKHCTQCGHVLGLGRFCTNCGHPVASRHADPLSDPIDLGDGPPLSSPVEAAGPDDDDHDWRTDTAERGPRPAGPDDVRVAAPPALPRLPPAVLEAPPPPRFPLFADEVVPAETAAETPASYSSPDVPDPVPAGAWEEAEVDDEHDHEDWDEWDEDWEDRRRPRALWVAGAVLLLAALVVGAWFLGQALGDDDEPAGDPSPSGSAEAGQDPVDHTAEASAEAPRTAPSTQDVDGNPTSYDASNMLDGVPETAWRAAGDGSGFKLVFTFPEKTRISEVGLVNGYAKTATDDAGATFDWYAGHRRITQVTWNFGAGDLVRQDLEDSRTLQTVEVGPVEVRKVVLKIVATTAPGDGPARRDFTAISDVFLAG